LKFVRAVDPEGTTWNTPVTVDVHPQTGTYSSLNIINGNPAISYFDDDIGAIKYVRATDADGTSWSAPVIVDAAVGFTGGNTSLKTVNGVPAISYYDDLNKDLKFIIALDANGISWSSPVTVDATGNVGRYCSLSIINGNPAISYYDEANTALKFIRAIDISGSVWSAPLTLESTLNVGTYTSLTTVNGNPAISYMSSTNGQCKYIRAIDANGTLWSAPIAFESIGTGGEYTSLAIVNGHPAITYYDHNIDNLKYIRAINADGANWAIPVSFDTDKSAGLYTCMSVVAGNPAISYYDASNSDLKYVRSADAGGTLWAAPVTVDATGGFDLSLKIVNGNPAMAYTSNNFDLKYVRASNSTGSSWGTPIIIDATVNAGYNSLSIINGNPAISYYDGINNDLKYVRASNSSGTLWDAPVIVASAGVVGLYSSLTIINGNPAIAYFDQTNGLLKYVRATNSTGTAWGTPVTVDLNSTVGLYPSLTTINGNPAISYFYLNGNDLKFARASDINGTTWSGTVTVDGTATVGQYTSLVTVNGNPAISYYERNGENLRYIRALNANGTVWSSPTIVYSNGNVGKYSSIAVLSNGSVGIAYYDETEFWPMFVAGTMNCIEADVPTISASINPICNGTSTTLSISSGNLQHATDWQWYSGSCGGTLIGTGNSITVSPTFFTTYRVRGEGGCVQPGPCASISVSVSPNANAGTITGNSPLCIGETTFYTKNGNSGGSWSSSDPLVATVNSSSGLVTTLSSGTTNIIYTVSSGCYSPVSASKTLSVSPNVYAGTVSGISPMCTGHSAIYTSNGDAGGNWSSSNPTIATVDESGSVTTLSSGTTKITYTVSSGCNSPATTAFDLNVNGCSVNLEVKVFMEGFYRNNGLIGDPTGGYLYLTGFSPDVSAVDTIRISAVNPITFNIADESWGILQLDGTVSVDFDENVMENINYYIKINHQNSIETWSSLPVTMSMITNYDFTTSASKAFGNNMVETFDQIGWAIFSGDVNNDGSIDISDYLIMDPKIQDGEGGYNNADITGDGAVDITDYLMLDINIKNGVGLFHP
jgi:hypothetical protein